MVRTYSYCFIVGLGVVFLFNILDTSVFAQGTIPATATSTSALIAPTTDIAKKQVVPAKLVANINLTDVNTKVKDNTIYGGFALKSFSGQQNDIRYGIVVYNDQGSILDATYLGSIPSIQEGESVSKAFTYKIPTYIQGNVVLVLRAETSAGLTLGSKEIWKGELKGYSQNLICTQKKSSIDVVCTSKLAGQIKNWYVTGGLFGDRIGEEEMRYAQKDKAFTIKPLLKAGEYYLYVTNNTEQKVILLIVTGSPFANIQNIMVYRDAADLTQMTILVRGLFSQGTTLLASLKNEEGVVCYSTSTPINSPVLQMNFESSCQKGIATLRVIDGNKSELVSMSQPFSTISAEKGKGNFLAQILRSLSLNLTIIILCILVLMGIGFFMRKKHTISSIES